MDIGKLLENVVDEMLEGFQVIGRDWRYLYVNRTVAQQGKSSKDALLGRTMMECYPGIENTPFFDQLKKCMDERLSIRMENKFTFPDGSTGWFLLSLHPVEQGVLILSADITAKKLSEALLREKIEELERVVVLAPGLETHTVEVRRIVARLKDMAPPLSPRAEPY